ncbi:substrate-binding periplasmic protein [Psychromonas sp. KJ10-10]|uniref:substrate-binding periplasmic protein n=1 Tax=Psychromonas sp. KJ10-10 TaxID=3391823 RepID=UPI0039B6135C
MFAYAETTLTFSKVQNTQDQIVSAEILKVAYNKLGISINTIDMPPKRSIQEANESKVDGEVSRVFEIGQFYPQLIRIPTSINLIEPSVFSKNLNFTVTDCEALKYFSIAVVRGAKFAELCTKGMDYVFITNSLTQALNLLERDRVDVVIATKRNGLEMLKYLELDSIGILSPALKSMPLHHYLNAKHKDLAVKVDDVLSKMEKSGELQTLRTQILKGMSIKHNANKK